MATPKLDEEQIFHLARQIAAPEARRQYVQQACGDDAALKARVEALLRVYEQESSFLQSPAGEAQATVDDPIRERPGTVIGSYKLIQQIGEGGMGAVFLAEQTHPVQRKVALKIIKPGMDSRQVIARFEAERQALALMDHPHIAKVLDGGTTDSGRPYFVMELVKGVPITKYCDEHHLTPRERLELFIPVCQAVQHAHQKGIIHRDLKPSNVMIALYDGKPVPKVIDFGVAKATGPKLTERTLCTEFGAVVGTFEYMSPEQAELNQLDIDTRSDIYSLGVLLYELLTGSTPLQRKRMKEAALLEVLRLIREEEPPRPSTRLSTTEELPAIAANRGLEPKKLSRLVRGELDWIVMKALEKDRNRRYETAAGLARDIERYLHDEPVQACPPSALYRFRKFVRRYKQGLVTAALVGLMLIGSLAALALSESFSAARLRIESGLKDRANNDLERANQELGKANKELEQEKAALRQEKQQTQINLSTFLMDKGLDLCEKGEIPLGLLWLARSLESAPAEAADLQRALRRNLVSWPREVSLPQMLLSHQGVRSVAMTGDGKTILTVSFNGNRQLNNSTSVEVGEVRRWDAITGEPIGTPIPHQGPMSIVTLSPDGRLAAVGEDNKTARLWDLTRGEPRGVPLPHVDDMRGAIFSADGRTLLTHTLTALHVWETATAKRIGQPIRAFAPPNNRQVVALSADGQLVLVAGDTQQPQLWRTATGQKAGLPLIHRDEVIAAVFSPDGERVVTAGRQQLRVWEVASGNLTQWRWDIGCAQRWAFSPDNIAVGYGQPNTKPEVRAIGPRVPVSPMYRTLDDPGSASLATVSPDGFLIATASGQTVRLWTMYGVSFGLPLQHPAAVTALAFSPDGQAVVTACSDGTVRLWGLAWPTGGETWRLRSPFGFHHPFPEDFTALSANGKILLRHFEGRGFINFAQVWDVTTRKPISPLLPNVWHAIISPDGQKVLAHHPPSQSQVTDADGKPVNGPDGQPLYRKDPGAFWLWQAGQKWQRIEALNSFNPGWPRPFSDFDPSGKTTVLVSAVNSARLWDVATWKAIGPPLTLSGGRRPLAVAPDGRTIMMAGGREAQLWDARAGRALGPPLPHPGTIQAASFSPDGQILAICSDDRTVRLWQVASGKPLGLPLHHPKGAMAVGFCPEGATPPAQPGRFGDVSRVAFSPDGATLLTAIGDGKVRFWDAHTGRPLGLPGPLGQVNTLTFTSDGHSALACNPANLVRWDAPPPAPEAAVAQIVLWIEVMTGRYLDAAGVNVWLNPTEWSERRKRLLAQGGPPVAPVDRLAWHRHWADTLRDNSFVARWHLDRLIAAEPGQWKHYLARGKLWPLWKFINGRMAIDNNGVEKTLADYSQAIALGAEGPEVWERRAFVYSQQEKWDKAAADYGQAAQHGGGGRAGCQQAQTLWKAGRIDAYRRVCADLLDRFGQTDDAGVAQDLALVCLLDPKPQLDLERVARLVEKALADPWEAPSEDRSSFRDEVVDRESDSRETLALVRYRAGQFEAAIRCLNERAKDNPPGRRLSNQGPSQTQLLLLAMVHQRLGRRDKAKEYLVASIAADRPGSLTALRLEAEALIGPAPKLELAEAHYRLGLTREGKKDWDAAIWHFNQAVRLKRDHTLAHQHLGNVHLQKKEFWSAIPAYRQALRLEPNKAETRNRLGSALNEFALLRISQHLSLTPAGKKEGVELAKEAVALVPAEGSYWNTLGQAYYRTEEWKDAVTALQKAMDLRSGGDSSDWFFLAMSQWQQGEKELARKWYAAAVLWMDKYRAEDEPLRRTTLEAAQLLQVTPPLRRIGRAPADTVAIWTGVLEVKPDLRIAHNERAEAYAALAQWDKAAADYTRLIGAEPPGNEVWFHLACARLLAGDTKGYQELCHQVRARAGETKDPFIAYLASRIGMLSPQGRIEPAQLRRWAEQAVTRDPKCAWYLHTLGAAHYRAGDFDQAVRRCRESLGVQPDWGGAPLNWLLLAMAHQRLGHAEEAQQWRKNAEQWAGGSLNQAVWRANIHPSDCLEFNVLARESEAVMKEPAPAKADKKP